MRRDVGSERTKLKMRIAVSGASLLASFTIILGGYSEVPREWAFGVVLLVLWYWLR